MSLKLINSNWRRSFAEIFLASLVATKNNSMSYFQPTSRRRVGPSLLVGPAVGDPYAQPRLRATQGLASLYTKTPSLLTPQLYAPSGNSFDFLTHAGPYELDFPIRPKTPIFDSLLERYSLPRTNNKPTSVSLRKYFTHRHNNYGRKRFFPADEISYDR